MEEQGGSSSGQRDGAIAVCMEGALEGLFVHRGPSHPPSMLVGCRDRHCPSPSGGPQGDAGGTSPRPGWEASPPAETQFPQPGSAVWDA